MTHLLGRLVVDDPCPRCRDRHVWLLKYHSRRYDRFICLCERCGATVVAETKRALLAKAGGRLRSGMPKRVIDSQV